MAIPKCWSTVLPSLLVNATFMLRSFHSQLCASFCASVALAWKRFATSKTRFMVPR